MPRTLRPVTPLARLILASGKTLYVTAAEVGINYSRMSDYANGRMEISSLHRAKLTEYFGADPTTGERQASDGGGDDQLTELEPVVFWASLGPLKRPARPRSGRHASGPDRGHARGVAAAGCRRRVDAGVDGDDRVTRRLPESAEGLWWCRSAEVKVLNLDAADTADGPVLRVRLRVDQPDRNAAFEYLAPGGVSAPRPRTLFRQALFAFTRGDDPPAVELTPLAETNGQDGEAVTDLKAIVDEGSEVAVRLMIEMLTYGTLRDKMRALAFFRRFLGAYMCREVDQDDASARFEELLTEVRRVEPSAAKGSVATPGAQPGPVWDEWATSGVECPEALIVAGRGP
jgi:hypothetical protein